MPLKKMVWRGRVTRKILQERRVGNISKMGDRGGGGGRGLTRKEKKMEEGLVTLKETMQ